MKLRFTVTCEYCKRPAFFGTSAVKLHGRYWHLNCVHAWRRTRRKSVLDENRS